MSKMSDEGLLSINNQQQRGSLYSRLSKVLSQIESVPKSGYNAYHRYRYIMESDLTEHIRPLLAAEGISLVFGADEIKELPNDCIAVKCNITLGDESGNEITANIWGVGQDKGDKGIYKAMTGAMKYFLYKSFLVSTGDDPEQESPTGKPTPAQRAAAKRKKG